MHWPNCKQDYLSYPYPYQLFLINRHLQRLSSQIFNSNSNSILDIYNSKYCSNLPFAYCKTFQKRVLARHIKRIKTQYQQEAIIEEECMDIRKKNIKKYQINDLKIDEQDKEQPKFECLNLRLERQVSYIQKFIQLLPYKYQKILKNTFSIRLPNPHLHCFSLTNFINKVLQDQITSLFKTIYSLVQDLIKSQEIHASWVIEIIQYIYQQFKAEDMLIELLNFFLLITRLASPYEYIIKTIKLKEFINQGNKYTIFRTEYELSNNANQRD